MLTPTIPARERLDRDETETLRRNGNLILDDRRRRPLWFDGRFLTARDLNREQHYFLIRQSDLNRAYGSGVVSGLFVGHAEQRSQLTIEPGHGVTPAGELVAIGKPLALRLSDIPEMQRLDASFGLLKIPRESPRTRSGLFIVALRPVEFSANPITSYPTSITGTRTVEDGDIVEATVVTLIPYPNDAARNELSGRRSMVAKDIFLGDGVKGVPAGLLPLAMIALDRGILQWIDNDLVRRELSIDPRDAPQLGLPPRAHRIAHLHQYLEHFHEIVEQRRHTGLPANFPATDHFLALPPCGQLPSATINPIDFTQSYFPSEMDVELSIVPEDELPTLVDEALHAPPIDLTAPAEERESTSILILAPVPRQDFRRYQQALRTLSLPVKPASPGSLAKRTPLHRLLMLRLPKTLPALPQLDESDHVTWRQILRQPVLWYIRRRNVHIKQAVTGTVITISPGPAEEPQPIPPPEPTPSPSRPGTPTVTRPTVPLAPVEPVGPVRPTGPGTDVLRPGPRATESPEREGTEVERPSKRRKGKTRTARRKTRTQKRTPRKES